MKNDLAISKASDSGTVESFLIVGVNLEDLSKFCCLEET